MTNAALVALRTTFFLVAIGLGVGLINSDILPREPAWIPWMVMVGVALYAPWV